MRKGEFVVNSKKKGMSLIAKQRAAGWTFLAPASILIAIMSFYPMVRAFIISLQKGTGANMRFTGFSNYQRILVDKVFQQSIGNTFFYLIIQVPIMLILAILLAQLLNNKHLKLRGLFRTCVFLPCATSLVSYSLIFRSMFATDGLINSILMKHINNLFSGNFSYRKQITRQKNNQLIFTCRYNNIKRITPYNISSPIQDTYKT